MIWIYLVAAFFALLGGISGYMSWFQVKKLNRSRILNLLLFGAVLFTLLMGSYMSGLLSQAIAAALMTFVYSLFAGFFTGYALRMIRLRDRAGAVLYVHRSFLIDYLPAIAAILLILFGLYRTSLLLEQPVTAIRLTSGLSLMAFGFLGWTLKIVPEFRDRGIFLLDHQIDWPRVISWRWNSEEVLRVEYLYKPKSPDREIRSFQTRIPLDERKQLESVLSSMMERHAEKRHKLISNPDAEFP